MRKTGKASVYERVTQQILSAIENSPGDPVMPWHRSGTTSALPLNATTKNKYRGMNILMLWMASAEARYPTNQWASYKQWQSVGAQVRKGEGGTAVIYYGSFEVEPTKPDGPTERRFAKLSTVFNAAQVDGYAPNLEAVPDYGAIDVDQTFQLMIANSGADISYGGQRACYAPATDTIQMPPQSLFRDTPTMPRREGFMSTLAHEMAHWTGHKSRLDRIDLSNRFGTFGYAAEECVAELSACFVSAQLGIACEPRADHAQYIAHYMQMMKKDPSAIFKAAADAQRACDYLLAFVDTPRCDCNSGAPLTPLKTGDGELLQHTCPACHDAAVGKYLPTIFDTPAAAA